MGKPCTGRRARDIAVQQDQTYKGIRPCIGGHGQAGYLSVLLSVCYVGEPDAAMSCPSGSEGAGRKRILARGQRAALPPYATQLLNAGCRVTSIQKFLGHKELNTTMIYARVHDQTVTDDYYAAMDQVEKRLNLLGVQEIQSESVTESERSQLLGLIQ